MARIFITGSADGLGSLAARALVKNGHRVVLHARNGQRAAAAREACPGAEAVLVGDLSTMAEVRRLAEEANRSDAFDCVIHNAGLYRGGPARGPAAEGNLPSLFAVNTIAPYLLTCLMKRPKRLVYVTSGYHHSGDASLRDLAWRERGDGAWNDLQAYADTKLHDVLLAKGVARRWGGTAQGDGKETGGEGGEGKETGGVKSNALDPGWVPTKMGGKNATGSLDSAVETYVMLAEGHAGTGGDETGKLFGPRRRQSGPKREAQDVGVQDRLFALCEEITGVKFPA